MDTMTTPTATATPTPKPCPYCSGTALPRPSEVDALRARIAELDAITRLAQRVTEFIAELKAAAQPAKPPGDLHWLLETATHVDSNDPELPVYYGVRDGERWAACSKAGAEALCERYGWTPDKRDTDPAP